MQKDNTTFILKLLLVIGLLVFPTMTFAQGPQIFTLKDFDLKRLWPSSLVYYVENRFPKFTVENPGILLH